MLSEKAPPPTGRQTQMGDPKGKPLNLSIGRIKGKVQIEVSKSTIILSLDIEYSMCDLNL